MQTPSELIDDLLAGLRAGAPLRRLAALIDDQQSARIGTLRTVYDDAKGRLTYYADMLERQLGRTPSDLHLNPASQLPPVDCPLLIDVDGKLERVVRPAFVERRGQDLTYHTPDGRVLVGQYRWTYP